MSQMYVALLRGINVGRAKRVAMADLRALVAGLGHADVRTLLNSGNVIFRGRTASAARVAGAIEQRMVAQLGVRSRVTLLTAREVHAIMEENPLGPAGDDPARLMVAVPNRAAHLARVAPLLAQGWEPELLALGTRAAYLWCPGGTIQSRLVHALDRALGDAVTTRNWATMLKLHAAVGATGERSVDQVAHGARAPAMGRRSGA